MAAAKSKHVSFPNQREQCRLNKFTYTEKCSCGTVTLMCNYPFTDPKHKKGVCRASTCTDMRKTLAEDIDEIAGAEADVVMDEAPRTGGNIDDTSGTDSAEEEAASGGVAPDDAETAGAEADPKGAVRAE